MLFANFIDTRGSTRHTSWRTTWGKGSRQDMNG
jgi:hypothetical protein